jgi:hypothetical protein
MAPDAKKQLWELKARISSSTLTKEQKGTSSSYQTIQNAVHKPFSDKSQASDPEFIAAQKLKLSKANFILGHSPPSYTSVNSSSFQ